MSPTRVLSLVVLVLMVPPLLGVALVFMALVPPYVSVAAVLCMALVVAWFAFARRRQLSSAAGESSLVSSASVKGGLL